MRQNAASWEVFQETRGWWTFPLISNPGFAGEGGFRSLTNLAKRREFEAMGFGCWESHQRIGSLSIHMLTDWQYCDHQCDLRITRIVVGGTGCCTLRHAK